ncbi:13874_t:CDS:2, partial [Racocetra persica]
ALTIVPRSDQEYSEQQMLLDWLDETHCGQYDFVYLRIDFKNKCNVGYAFVNFVDISAVLSFAKTRVGKKWYLHFLYLPKFLHNHHAVLVTNNKVLKGRVSTLPRFVNYHMPMSRAKTRLSKSLEIP